MVRDALCAPHHEDKDLIRMRIDPIGMRIDLILRSIAKRCVSKDEAIEVQGR